MFLEVATSESESDWLKRISNVERDGRRRPLATFIREVIREEIRSGLIGPGERLIEEDLADAFDVSRTPVREALRQLQVEGLVQSVHNRGFVVNDILEDVEKTGSTHGLDLQPEDLPIPAARKEFVRGSVA